MSVYLFGVTRAKISDLFDGRFEKFNIVEKHTEESSPTHRCLTDGIYEVWVQGYRPDHPLTLDYLSEYGRNPVLEAISRAFGVHIAVDTHPDTWAPESEEAWSALEKEQMSGE